MVWTVTYWSVRAAALPCMYTSSWLLSSMRTLDVCYFVTFPVEGTVLMKLLVLFETAYGLSIGCKVWQVRKSVSALDRKADGKLDAEKQNFIVAHKQKLPIASLHYHLTYWGTLAAAGINVLTISFPAGLIFVPQGLAFLGCVKLV